MENNNLNIEKIGDKINVVDYLLILAKCNWYQLLKDLMHADENVEKY